MTDAVSHIRHITIDCRDPIALARFWSDALGFVDDPQNPNEAGDPEALIVDPTGRDPGLLFIGVPEAKSVKNRIHLDLQPQRTSRDVTVDQLLSIGATLVADHRRPDGTGWAVLADPEGNELCVERSATERSASIASSRTSAPSAGRASPPIRTADERTMLLGMLDWYRAGVIAKVAGLGDALARRRLLGSDTTIVGLIKHLALVEDSWLFGRFAGNAEPAVWAEAPFDEDPDWEFHSALAEPLADLVALYETCCARSRGVCASAALDDVGLDTERPFTLRYALVHLIEETARHLGHLDLLREMSDGVTGD